MDSINNRIEQIKIFYFGEERGNHKKFCDTVGVASNTASNWMKDGYPIGLNVISQISQAFPKLNVRWLLDGEGCIETGLIHSNRESPSDIAILDIRVSAGHGIGFDGDENKILGFVNIPNFAGCYGVTVYGDSMYDKYSSGDTVFVREIKDRREIEGGQPYVVITNEDRYLKMIYIEDEGLKLVSYNNSINPDGRRKYPDMLIEGKQIKFLYKVVGRLERTQI
jgi:SOS-response transcriptional repressor LexA